MLLEMVSMASVRSAPNYVGPNADISHADRHFILKYVSVQTF